MTDKSAIFLDVFHRLRPLLADRSGDLIVAEDEPDRYALETQHVMKNGQRLFFGAVEIKKRYVAYHLMPVYVRPDLLDGVTDALKKRMQGKSCFNFAKPDDALFDELSALTERGLESYRAAGHIS